MDPRDTPDEPLEPAQRRGWLALGVFVLGLILIPFVLWEEQLSAVSRAWLQTESSTSWVFMAVVVLLVADVLLPVPSSFISAAAVGLLGAAQGAIAVWIGMSLSAWAGYALGRAGGVTVATRMVGERELQRAGTLMERYGDWVLLLCRGIPVLAEASTLLAGTARSSALRFGAVTALGNLGLALAYAATTALDLQGSAALLAPFVFGVAVPGALIVALRVVVRRRAV